MEDLLQQEQKHLETRIEELVAEARKHGTKNKRAALMALKRKKRLESELARVDGTLTTTIELQREALGICKNNMRVLGAIRDATNVLKNASKHVTADKVLDIVDEVNEQQEIAKEIADAMSNPIGFMNSSDHEFELEKELEEFEQEELDKTLIKVNGSVRNDAFPEGTHFHNGAEEGRKVVSDSKMDRDKEPKKDEDEK